MDFRRKKRQPVDIGLIPMIDVLLVLLFFFMVATTFRHHSDLKINLPDAQGGEVQQQGKAVNLFVNAKGEYALAGESGNPIPLPTQDVEGLKEALSRLDSEARLQPIIINADGKATHQAVVSALDVANQLGFHQITFAVLPPDE